MIFFMCVFLDMCCVCVGITQHLCHVCIMQHVPFFASIFPSPFHYNVENNNNNNRKMVLVLHDYSQHCCAFAGACLVRVYACVRVDALCTVSYLLTPVVCMGTAAVAVLSLWLSFYTYAVCFLVFVGVYPPKHTTVVDHLI